MDGCGGRRRQRQFIDKHLGKKGARTGPGVGWAGRSRPPGPGPFRPGSAPVFSPVASRVIPYLCALACGPLTSFPSRFRLESLPCKLRCFLVESLKTCTLTLRSSGHLESCSSRVLTCDGLHDLLLKFGELIPKVSSLTLISSVNNKLQNRHASVNLLHH
jgi:hypothetical protein